MKKHLVKLAFSSGLIALALLLLRCGQPYCIAGIGKCSYYATGTGTNTTGGNGALNVVVSSQASALPMISQHAPATIMVSGGQPPYTMSLSNPTATTQSACTGCFNPNPITTSGGSSTLTGYPTASNFSCPVATTATSYGHYCPVEIIVKDVNGNFWNSSLLQYYIDY